MIKGNNEYVPMTRRTPNGLSRKQLQRDAKIANKLINAWDNEKDEQKVFDIFCKYKDQLSDQRYWETLRTVWIISGTIERIPIFRELFSSNKRFKYYFSTPEEIKYLELLPDKFTVYRAANDYELHKGISYTLSEAYAQQYKRNFNKSNIYAMQVNKSEVFAYINRNLEQEIIIL